MQAKALLKEKESPLLVAGKKNQLVRGVYDLLAKGVRGPGQLKKEAVLATLAELAGMHNDMPSIILDVIGVLDAETSAAASQDERTAFCNIVYDTEKFLSDKLLKERLEIDTLQDVGTVKNRIFYSKFIKVKTKL